MLDHIVLIGLNYQTVRSSGDKNFWVELIPLLARRLKRITVLSIRKHEKDSEEYTINGCQVCIRYLTPKFLETSDSKYGRKRLFWRAGAFPRRLGVIEKLLNTRILLKELSDLNKIHPFQHVHLMDNMGLANRLLARKLPSLSVSAMAYQGSDRNWLYHRFLRISYGGKNVTVVPYSRAYKEKLIQIGISEERISNIPWGVICSKKSVNQGSAGLDIPEDKPLVLWTGYIQQIQKPDFLYAIWMAEMALKRGLNAAFFFAFKPESFEPGFETYNQPDKGIFAKATTVSEFSFLKDRCNILFSPVVNANVILAPPLSWLEMLNNGVPIVTTSVPGAAEAVIDGVTGFVVHSDEELIAKLFAAVKDYEILGTAGREHVRGKYNIEESADSYLNMWQNLIKKREAIIDGDEIQG